MKLHFIVIILLQCVLTFGENLFQNADFSAVDERNMPLGWGVSTGDPNNASVKTGVLLAGSVHKNGVAISQKDIALQRGKRYTLAFEARQARPEQSRFHSYFEWSTQQGEKDVWGGYYPGERIPAKEWTPYTFTFTFPDEPAGKQVPYFALVVKGEGKLEFRNMSLESAERIPEKIANHDFSQNHQYWKFNGDTKITGGKLILKNSGGTLPSVSQDGIILTPGREYEIICEVNGKSIGEEYLKWNLELYWPDINHKLLFKEDMLNRIDTKRIIRFHAPLKPVPAGMKMTCVLPEPGAMTVTSFTLKALPKPLPPAVTVYFPELGVRQAVYRSTHKSPFIGKLSYAEGIVSCEISWCLPDGKIIDRPVINTASSFHLDPAKAPNGQTIICITPKKKDGSAAETIKHPLHIYPQAGNEALLGRDNILRINGKPFFPSFLFDFKNLDNADTLYYMARGGFNTIVGGSHELFDLFQQYGFKIVSWAGYPKDTTQKSLEEFRSKFIDKFRDINQHPAFLGYFLQDEPGWVGTPLENLLAAYRIIRELDPYHPVWINEAPRGTMELITEYGRACDIYGVDIYPVPPPHSHSGLVNKELSCIGDYALRMRRSVHDRKPVWMCLQGFSWDVLKQLNKPDPVYPSLHQLRYMYYDSMLNGARGIGLWGGYSIDRADFYENIRETTKEITQMATVWYAPEDKSFKPSTKTSGIAMFARVLNGSHYLIVANRTKETVNIQVQLGKPLQLKTIFEERNYQCYGPVLTDTLAPYDVRVYTDGSIPTRLQELPPTDKLLETVACPMLGNERVWQTSAKWLWRPTPPPGNALGTVTFSKNFKIKGDIEAAWICADGDDVYTLVVNGTSLRDKKPGSWNLVEVYDITKLLKEGDNNFTSTTQNFNGPGGFVAELTVRYRNGKVERIPSDSSWLVTEGKTFDATKAVQAYEQTPFGKGAWSSTPTISFRQVAIPIKPYFADK